MSRAEVAKAYRGYMESVLKRYGGEQALETIKDPKTAAAFADTLFMHGGNGGAQIIKEATNEVIDRISDRVQDQVGGSVLPPAERNRKGGTSGPKDEKTPSKAPGPKDTLDNIRRLEAGGFGKELRNEIAKRRIAKARDPRVDPRIDHFRF